ncbi:MAG: L,D-transpeptidase [Proteobacteria bacterium]|nr:L,D-transpeptidase [Pseudomonadota bacterium]
MKLESRPQTLVLESPDGTRTFTISSGKKGHGTPRGCFTVDKTVRNYWSRKYNSPMPWSVFFHAGAYATHGTPYVGQLGAPASHGCVRLHPDNAKIVFETVNKYSRSKALLCIGS